MEPVMFLRKREALLLLYRHPTLLYGPRIAVCALGMFLLAGCLSVTKPTPTLPTPIITPTPVVISTTSLPAPTATLNDPTEPLTLTLWLPPEMAPGLQDTPMGHVLDETNQAFVAANPRLRLEIIPKASWGAGGIAHTLLATQPVVPQRMPDIVAIDIAELPKLVQKGILSPLDGLIPAPLWDDLYAFAGEAVTVDGQRFALPFYTDITFLVHNNSLIQSPPLTWDRLDDIGADYIFPAARGDGSTVDAFLLQYLAHGEKLDAQLPHLDSTVLAKVLRDYLSAIEIGVVPETIRDLGTLDDCWAIYLAGDAGMANTSSWHYQRDHAMLQRTRYARIPTASGKPITLARPWAWAVVTQDPIRQEAAARYIVFMLRPDNLSPWIKASFHLPTHHSILTLVIQDENYCTFIDEQLQNAYSYPDMRGYSQVQPAVMRAIQDVLDGIATPERAAVTAAAMIARLK